MKAAFDGGIREVLLGHSGLSAQGSLNPEEMNALAAAAVNYGIKPVILWDTLMCDPDLDAAGCVLLSLELSLFSAIRVLDPGALGFVLENTNLPIQLILRSGNHNIESILGWISFDRRVVRVVLSSELPKTRLDDYLKRIPVEVEILGVVPILLFYTPRHLLTFQGASASSGSMLSALASCEEDSHSGFRVIETRHGTLMFHSKDYNLLDKVAELQQIGVAAFQIDFRLEETERATVLFKSTAALFNNFSEAALMQWQTAYPHKTTRCFYQANATDVLFKKLKNTTTQRTDNAYIGEVVESLKDQHTIIHVTGKAGKLTAGTSLQIITPNGKTVSFSIGEIRNLDGELVAESVGGEFAVLPYLRSVTPTSVVYHAG